MIRILMFLLALNCYGADFNTGSDKPTKQLLEKVEKELKDNKNVVLVVVETHADTRGSKESNMTLTEKRAESVKKLLESKGVKAKIIAVGKGEMQPISLKHSQNRRVELTTLNLEELCPQAVGCSKKHKTKKNILSGYIVNSRQGLNSSVRGLNGEVRSEFGNGLGIMYQREILDDIWLGGGLDTNKGKMLTIGFGF